MKRCSVVIGAVGLLAMLTGCGGPGKSKRLTLWHIQVAEATKKVVDDAVERFEKAGPGVAVQAAAIKNDSFKMKLSIALAGSRPPDVFHTWGGGGLAEFVKAGAVLDLSDAFNPAWQARFTSAALDFCRVDGRLYAVPVDLAAVVMWYNRSIFARHKLDPPRTLAELKVVCRKLRRAGITPIALGNSPRWPGAFYFIYLADRIGGGRPFAEATSRAPGGTFRHASFVRAGEELQKLVDENVFSKGFNAIDYNRSRAQFLNREAAMTLMGTWLLSYAQQEQPAALEWIDCFPFPTVAGGVGDPTVLVGGTNAAYAISSACRRPQAAQALLRELTSPAGMQGWPASGRIPAARLSTFPERLPPPTRKVMGLLRSTRRLQLYYDQFLPPRLAELHKKTTQSLLAKQMTPREAAAAMETLAAELRAGEKRD